MTQPKRHIVKILLLGESGVGKSAISQRFIEDTFTDTYLTTVGVDFKTKELEVDNIPVKVQLWDTGSAEWNH